MKKLLIIGAGGHARQVIATLHHLKEWELIGIIDTNYQGQLENILGLPVLGAINIIKEFEPVSTDIVLAIGNNEERKKLFLESTLQDFNFPNFIHRTALVDPSAHYGKGNFIGPFSQIGPRVKIGSANIINSYANIEHETEIGDYNQIAPNAVVCGRCKIGSQVFIGANATLIDRLSIVDRTVVGAGAVITKNISEMNQTFVGIPGRKI